MGHLSVERRWAIVAHWKSLGTPQLVASVLKLRLKVVRRWVERYQSSGGVDELRKSGRRPVINAAAAEHAHDLLLSGDKGFSGAVAYELHAAGLTPRVMHRTTVARAAHRVALARGEKLVILRGKPSKQLSAATMIKRLAFSKDNLTRGMSHVMFTDRKKFHFYYPGHKVHPVTWALRGQRREAAAVNHAQCVNLYAGITKWGLTDLHVVAGTSGHKTTYKNKGGQLAKNITSEEYANVVRKTFLPEGQRMFSQQGISTWVLQQDNDPTHRAAHHVVDQWNAQHGSHVSIMKNWPPSSPDFNPIENFWSHLQRIMDGLGCKTFAEYKEALVREAKATPQTYFSKLVGSVNRRLAKSISLEGGKTGY